jgi:hypothetical protein
MLRPLAALAALWLAATAPAVGGEHAKRPKMVAPRTSGRLLAPIPAPRPAATPAPPPRPDFPERPVQPGYPPPPPYLPNNLPPVFAPQPIR